MAFQKSPSNSSLKLGSSTKHLLSRSSQSGEFGETTTMLSTRDTEPRVLNIQFLISYHFCVTAKYLKREKGHEKSRDTCKHEFFLCLKTLKEPVARKLSWLERHPDTPRVWVQSLVRAHTRVSQ